VQTSEDIKTICEKLQAIDGIEHVNRINKAWKNLSYLSLWR
jgi:hypothetical protein